MYFETHAHYDDKAFDEDRDAVLASLADSNVNKVIIPGCDIKSTNKARDISEKYPFVYFAAGIHPEEIAGISLDDVSEVSSLAEHDKCVAIGEIGLDYYWESENKTEQMRLFEFQMQLAYEMKMPVIIHDREAHKDTFDIIKNYPEVKGVFHCYSGSAEMAELILKQGYYLGFDGPITYKNNVKSIDVLKMCPPERILIETDSPYLSPVPMRGQRNDSRNLRYIVEKIAEIKNLGTEEIETITYENAKACFNL